MVPDWRRQDRGVSWRGGFHDGDSASAGQLGRVGCQPRAFRDHALYLASLDGAAVPTCLDPPVRNGDRTAGASRDVEDSKNAIRDARNGRNIGGTSPAQLSTCPWCGAPIDPQRDIIADDKTHTTTLYCSDPHCTFSETQERGGIPVKVVDDEMYHRPPTMMIATADKFAQMAWRGSVRNLFGYAEKECVRHGLVYPDDKDCNGNHTKPATHAKAIARIRPPDLIIQDEFHLISGPLRTLVGLYEMAVDELCSWQLDENTKVHPKVIASTATVRMADEQIRRVFYRKCAVFPPSGIDVEDNFFSVQRPIEDKYGRDYIGICALGMSRPAALIRTYVAFLTAGQTLLNSFGPFFKEGVA